MGRKLIRAAIPLVAAAVWLLTGGHSADATIAMTGDWQFTIQGDLTLSCPTMLLQEETTLTGMFDCTQYTGTLDGTVTPAAHGQTFEATVVFTDQHGHPLDAWDISGAVPGEGNHMTGDWQSTIFEDESGTLFGVRDVSVYVKGDINCDGDVDASDVLSGVRWGLDLDPLQPSGCPEIGVQFGGGVFGDLDCDGQPLSADGVYLLWFAAGLPVQLPQGCLPIGELYTLPASAQR
ncbi:MAG TPA: hypothetical protein VMT90_05925 [Dehalococcoidia bacterium]|nr:hypothetical protein [Dehalococcoidia bacterium]